jgi:hypothetical protein
MEEMEGRQPRSGDIRMGYIKKECGVKKDEAGE